ncbi:protein disulfide oxidoreductase [Thioalkalivibrio sp. ALJ7]|uniref:protein disulfide oxidoreductase n=1 Tax=Thioalkalivibrio sp. ALJ7 TaxID=1158756 RepID=UPI000366D42B|nr:protein disulfide oxidoreductase [Thioalkalivibrio sp. ALJ7]
MTETPPEKPKRPKPSGRRRALSWGIQIGLALVIFLVVRAWMARDMVEGPAPEFEAQLLDGTPVTLADYADEPMLLHFWATWCPICRLEEGEIVRLSQSHPVLTVAMQSGTPEEVLDHLNERERELAVVNDPQGALAAQYNVRGVPATFIINPDGEIVFRKQGYAPPFELRLRLWLARWL